MKNLIMTGDALFGRLFRRYKYCCIVDTSYALLLFLLYIEGNDINNTLFYVGDNIDREIRNKLPNSYYYSSKACDYSSNKQRIKFMFIALLHRVIYIRTSRIFAQDHISFAPQLIGNRKYVLIEDSAMIFSRYRRLDVNMFDPNQKVLHRIKLLIQRGAVWGKAMGENRQCINRIITNALDSSSEYFVSHPERRFEILDICKKWSDSTYKKRERIQDIFNISINSIYNSISKHTILLTTPLREDYGLTDSEYLDVYHKYLMEYQNDIVIKPHPRDNFNWTKQMNKNIPVIPKYIPFQLLSLLGYTFARAITVDSSAVSLLSNDTVIIWLGSSCHQKIFDILGPTKCPYKHFKKIVELEPMPLQ